MPSRTYWEQSLPSTSADLLSRWSLQLIEPGTTRLGTCSWIAPVITPDGTQAVLKLGFPHMEAEDEGAGLRFWDGNPTVRLLAQDKSLHALLLERCLPGTSLRLQRQLRQDEVIAALLRRLWRPRPSDPEKPPFRHLSSMLNTWRDEALQHLHPAADDGLVQAGLDLFSELGRPAATDVLLATDLHAGNVLEASREPWLVIDPKPFVGDRAYDASQHLLNCRPRLRADPVETVKRFADLLELNDERIRLWTWARAAVATASAAPGDGRSTKRIREPSDVY